MIETELLTFPLEGKDKFIAEMKIFNEKLTYPPLSWLRPFAEDIAVALSTKTSTGSGLSEVPGSAISPIKL